ncbi:MAG: hypothetical protein IKS15_05945 [Opitutales bacterium]|nr:hypothetical protein [Opitutales bacterium]
MDKKIFARPLSSLGKRPKKQTSTKIPKNKKTQKIGGKNSQKNAIFCQKMRKNCQKTAIFLRFLSGFFDTFAKISEKFFAGFGKILDFFVKNFLG